jgi:non-ribosomal peptide synthetase component F
MAHRKVKDLSTEMMTTVMDLPETRR